MNLQVCCRAGLVSLVLLAGMTGCRSSSNNGGFFGRWRASSSCCGTSSMVADTSVGGCSSCGDPVIIPGRVVTPLPPGAIPVPGTVMMPGVPGQPGILPPGQIGPAPLPPMPAPPGTPVVPMTPQ